MYFSTFYRQEELLQPVKKRREKKRAKGKAVADDSDLVPTEHLLGEFVF